MKNGKMIGAIVVLFLVIGSVSVMAGCITDDSTAIEGTLHNTTDRHIWISALHKPAGNLEGSEGMGANSTEIWELPVGAYTIIAYETNGQTEIGSDTLTISATDTTFTIIVYDSDVSATAS